MHPHGGYGLLPVYLAHALLHLGELAPEVLPLLAFLLQYLLGSTHPHRGKEVESLWRGARRRLRVVVHHLLQHLCVGLVALRHEAHLVVAGIFILRPDARLLLGDDVERRLQACHVSLAFQQLGQRLACLLQLSLHLGYREVVGLSHEVVHELVHPLVGTLHGLVTVQLVSHHRCQLHLFGRIEAERHTLQPHHPPEIPLQLLAAGIVASRTEQAVGELHLLILADKVAEGILRLHDLCHLLLGLFALVRMADGLARQQFVGYAEIHGVMVRQLPQQRRFALHGLGVHIDVHVVGEVYHQRIKGMLLQLAQHTVEIEVIELQEQIGRHKRGEVAVVVLLVDVEQLVVGSRDNGKAVSGQLLAEQRVKDLQLRGVHEVAYVHPQSLVGIEIQLLQLVLAQLQPLHEGLLLRRVFQHLQLVGGTVVVVAPRLVATLLDAAEVQALVKLPHQRVVPRRRLIDTAQIGILERETLTGGWGMTEHPQVA